MKYNDGLSKPKKTEMKAQMGEVELARDSLSA